MAGTTIWSGEEDDLLRRCAEQGQSAKEAAELLSELFSVERSRSAVIGRATRRGIVFAGKNPRNARQAAAAQTRKEATPKPARPKPETAVVVANLLRKRAQIRVEQERAQPAEAAAELAAMEAQTAEVAGDNPGVLFLERKALQCAWPQPGWDAVSVQEKRVCGRPVMMRAVAHGAQPTSWCRACTALAYKPSGRKLDAKYLSRLDRNVVRAA